MPFGGCRSIQRELFANEEASRGGCEGGRIRARERNGSSWEYWKDFCGSCGPRTCRRVERTVRTATDWEAVSKREERRNVLELRKPWKK